MEEEQGSGDNRLRARARKNLEEKRSVLALSDKEASELIEELSIHQEELKIQNEELMRVQIELEMSRAKYFQLYDLAPVGYITMNMDLIIKEANLAASMLLETNRNNMINRGISSFISDRCQETLYLHFLRVALKKMGVKETWPALRLLLKKKFLAIEIGITLYLGRDGAPLSVSFTIILGLGILMTIYYALVAGGLELSFAFLVVVQLTFILGFYFFVVLLAPQEQGVTPLARTTSDESKPPGKERASPL